MSKNVVAWVGLMGVECGIREDEDDEDVLL